MNRYRNVPGQRGPTKATATTLCQKCLKRDIYECKATAQDRPYVSRPSRTQQLQNPELVPKLKNETPGDLRRTDGLANEILAKAERERGRKRDLDEISHGGKGQSPKRPRSTSSRSSISVSTISTDRSRSKSPENNQYRYVHSQNMEQEQDKYQSSVERSQRRKRRHSEGSSKTTDSLGSEELSHAETRYTRRKRREYSPVERGRRRDPSTHGSRRHKSRSQSQERSRIVRERRSMTPGTYRQRSPVPDGERRYKENLPPRERSLSPFSKRLALTQAMNMGR